MDKMYYAKKYVEIFPEYTQELENHLISYGELLGHVFFGDLINPHLVELLRREVDTDRIEKIFSFINDMYLNGEDDMKNIVVVTILEYLGDDPLILKKAFQFLSEELKQESHNIEKQIGRDPFGKWNI
jgi:hypothetical protein